jgi:hypothetical protein
MLGIGAAIMLYVRFWGASDYLSMPRESTSPTSLTELRTRHITGFPLVWDVC